MGVAVGVDVGVGVGVAVGVGVGSESPHAVISRTTVAKMKVRINGDLRMAAMIAQLAQQRIFHKVLNPGAPVTTQTTPGINEYQISASRGLVKLQLLFFLCKTLHISNG